MRTLKLRIKDKHANILIQLASEALRSSASNVWNYVNELGFKHLQRTGEFFSAFDMAAYTKGASKSGLNLHSQTIQAITEELVLRRKQFKKSKLKWRVSNPKSAKKSLGWIPFKASGIQYQNGQIKYAGHWFGLWDSYGIKNHKVKTGSFVQDSRGRWYVCLVVDTPEPTQITEGKPPIGIDLGLKTLPPCQTVKRSKPSAPIENMNKNWELPNAPTKNSGLNPSTPRLKISAVTFYTNSAVSWSTTTQQSSLAM